MGNFSTPYPFNTTTSLLTDPGTDYKQFFGSLAQTSADLFFNNQNKATAAVTSSGSTKSKGMTPAEATTTKVAGVLTTVFAGINAAVGQFYAAKTQQYQYQSQASTLQFKSGMDAISAHEDEMNAQWIEEQGKTQVQQYTMRAGQDAAASTAATAARGIDLSSASAVDERASQDLMKQLGVLSINSNTERAAWAQRTQATAASNQSLLDRTQAINLLGEANAISPGNALLKGIASTAASVSSQLSHWD